MGVTRVKVGGFGKVLGCLGGAVGRIGIAMLQKGNLDSEAFFYGFGGACRFDQEVGHWEVGRCVMSNLINRLINNDFFVFCL